MMDYFPKSSRSELANDAYESTYREAVGLLNRAERRTARGRQLVAEAHAKALLAKIEILESEITDLKGGAE